MYMFIKIDWSKGVNEEINDCVCNFKIATNKTIANFSTILIIN